MSGNVFQAWLDENRYKLAINGGNSLTDLKETFIMAVRNLRERRTKTMKIIVHRVMLHADVLPWHD